MATTLKRNDDSARLDWLQAHRSTVYRSEGGSHWVVVDETATTRRGELGKDLRAAIDSAMSNRR